MYQEYRHEQKPNRGGEVYNCSHPVDNGQISTKQAVLRTSPSLRAPLALWDDADMDTETKLPATEVPGALTADEIREFQALVRAETGVVMDDAEAWSRATELVALFRMLAGPIPEDPET
jgi:hypothetical protein